MLRPVDIPVLLRLALLDAGDLSYQRLAVDLELSASEVHAAAERARLSDLLRVEGRSKRVNRSGLLEFLEHGLRYAFPAERGELTRGMPTAHAAEPLRSALQAGAEPVPVWPCAEGKVRGYSFLPLYRHAPAAARKSTELYALFALADALRDGRVRERKLALRELVARVRSDG